MFSMVKRFFVLLDLPFGSTSFVEEYPMRKTIIFVVLVITVLSGLLVRSRVAADVSADSPSDPGYTVHEWGTFTSFTGSDGVLMDFRSLADSPLPAFVMTRERQAQEFKF